jgi:hypothetical protein
MFKSKILLHIFVRNSDVASEQIKMPPKSNFVIYTAPIIKSYPTKENEANGIWATKTSINCFELDMYSSRILL